MNTPLSRHFLVFLLAAFAWSSSYHLPALASGLELELVAPDDDLGRSLGLTNAGDGSNRIFVIRQSGIIAILKDGVVEAESFLDISDRVACCEQERGLLGLAFHPDYTENGRFYVTYTATNLDTVLSRFLVSNNPDQANVASERELLRFAKQGTVHHGGHIAFGPDGYLYMGTGDGGARRESQDLTTYPGNLLRLDVSRSASYQVPASNPFVNEPDVLPEIWSYGWRNPWRFSFDRETGELFVGDVGGSQFEEISYQPAESAGGENYGWPFFEGESCVATDESECEGEFAPPIIEYAHKLNARCNSVTGGYRYRGPKQPTLSRFYIYGDFCRGLVWGARRNASGRWIVNELLEAELMIPSFGEDEAGELYLVGFRGGVHKLVGTYLFASDFDSGETTDWARRRGGLTADGKGLKRSAASLRVPLDGTKKKRFVRSTEPEGEPTFYASFRLSMNQADLGGGEVEIVRLAGNKRAGNLRATVSEEGGDYFLNVLSRDSTGVFRRLGRTVLPPRRAVRIEIDWMQASGAGAFDGEVAVSKNGKVRIMAADLDSAGQGIQTVTLGLPAGSQGAVGGELLIDDYRSSP